MTHSGCVHYTSLDLDIFSILRRDISIDLMTRALIAAILTVYQVLAWTCPVLCQGAPQHEAAVATEQRSVAAGEHHSHGHGADALAGVPSLSAVQDGCDNCAAPPTSMWSVTPKFATPGPSTVLAVV